METLDLHTFNLSIIQNPTLEKTKNEDQVYIVPKFAKFYFKITTINHLMIKVLVLVKIEKHKKM